MSTHYLPPSVKGQHYVTISPMAGGFITLPDHFFVHPAAPNARRTVPSLAFLINHPGTSSNGSDSDQPMKMMFDLGLRKSKHRYPEKLQTHLDARKPYDLSPGVAAQLRDGGVDPAEVNIVMLSHVHYDHHGDPEDFPNARFIVGHGTKDVLKHGLGGLASHQNFDPDTLPDDRTDELPDPTDAVWRQVGPFPAVLDLFNDGALYVIDTPGHLLGHINLLCRTQKGWICLCGDAYHDLRLLSGVKEIGSWQSSDGTRLCIHLDREQAEASIERLRELAQGSGESVELIAAHDEQWWVANQERMYPATL